MPATSKNTEKDRPDQLGGNRTVLTNTREESRMNIPMIGRARRLRVAQLETVQLTLINILADAAGAVGGELDRYEDLDAVLLGIADRAFQAYKALTRVERRRIEAGRRRAIDTLVEHGMPRERAEDLAGVTR